MHAGLDPSSAIQIATYNSGQCIKNYLDDSTEIGRIREGFEADLVLLNGNPLTRIYNILEINKVMSDGRWFDREELRQFYNDAADQYSD